MAAPAVAIASRAEVVWRPNPGPQRVFLRSTLFELLLHGDRGGGKTDALLMDFVREIGRGFGAHWRGILFRETYPQLEEAIAKSRRFFALAFPAARFNESGHVWKFPGGEALYFRHARRPADYYDYHGHEYPWVGWEELTNWASGELYQSMKTVVRSTLPGIPMRVRATTNPHGKGHNWVKAWFRIATVPSGAVIRDVDEKGKPLPPRAHLFCPRSRNEALQVAQPDYEQQFAGITDPNKRRAWLEGRWDIVAGGYFDDVWTSRNVLEPFAPPASWRWRLSLDWGSAKPASVGVWALPDGTALDARSRYPGRVFKRGSAIRMGELYTAARNARGEVLANEGLRLKNEELGARIAAMALRFQRELGARFDAGVADPSVFAEDGGPSIYTQIQTGARRAGFPLELRAGDNGRIAGWGRLRDMIAAASREPCEEAGLWVVGARCPDFLRTVPVLPRDERDPDDVDTDTEDHAADEARYLVQSLRPRVVVHRELIL